MAALLHGRSLGGARAALADLSARLLSLRPSDLPDTTLADGLAGVALAHANLEPVFPGRGHQVRAERALGAAIDRLARTHLDPGLHLGLAGLGWVAARLLDPSDHTVQRELFEVIDGALADTVASPWGARFDLVYGVAGIGVYALERLPSPSARRLVGLVVDQLAAAAQPQLIGVAWRTDPTWTSCDPKVPRPAHQELALGVAHGAAGVIALLGRVVAADVDARTRARARALLDRAVAWLLAQEHPAVGFPYHANPPEIARTRTRVAWCSGDLGLAAALLVAARATRTTAWRRAAVRAALRAAARPVDAAGVVDAGLCHGGIGVAHAFHRVFLATGDARFAGAARGWFAHGLALRTPGAGFAGFRARDPDRRHRLCWRSPPGFLTGGAGVALALAAATTGADPSWDRALLLS